MSRISVFACESQPIVLEGLAKVLAGCEDFDYIGSAPALGDAFTAVRQSQPDIVLVDHASGLKAVFEFIADVKNAAGNCQAVLWVHDLAEVDCFRALRYGARGILKKALPITALIDCLRAVARGDVWIEGSPEQSPYGEDRRSAPRLTPREKQIVQQICEGLKNKEIAQALSITAGTVKVHLMHIFEKTGVKDRFELAIQGRKLLGLDSSGVPKLGPRSEELGQPDLKYTTLLGE
ncbi:MAG: two component transcriptional regulator, LuxR family [Bryobacterales bacterium]|nr:two component transcriptional regulator, LuxR family [Bryobacterales bacterium]